MLVPYGLGDTIRGWGSISLMLTLRIMSGMQGDNCHRLGSCIMSVMQLSRKHWHKKLYLNLEKFLVHYLFALLIRW
jgi:hypothetical protein